MKAAPEDLAVFVRGLEENLLLPALWLVRHSGLGAILRSYQPDKRSMEIIEDRLIAENRALYEFTRERMEEN